MPSDLEQGAVAFTHHMPLSDAGLLVVAPADLLQAFGSQLNSFGQIQRFIAESYAEYQVRASCEQ